MKAVVLTRYGGPDVLRITAVAAPTPAPDEVRVRNRFIGINFAEVISRRGLYGWAPKLPYILGMESYGEIDAVGSAVRDRTIGERVIVGTKFGTYAEWICVPSARAFPALPQFSPQQNAAFAVSYLTAWVGLMEMARLRSSDTVLITSAAGGVGSAAIQIAKKSGARVIGAASKGKQDAVRALGADEAIAYDSPMPRADVVLEMSGGKVFRSAKRNIAPMGRIVVTGASSAIPGSRNLIARLRSIADFPRLNIFDMLRRSYGVMSFHIGWLLESGLVETQWADLLRFTAQHGLTPIVGQEFAFDDIASAHRALESRRNSGKVVVRI
jgi:NADPH:quinone reductase-like Zn-dependent oxidoreductase